MLGADGHLGDAVAVLPGSLHPRLRKLTGASFVNDQRLFAWAGGWAVGYTDMCPAVELADDLIKADAAGDDPTHHLVGGHTGHTDVSSAPESYC